MPINDSNDTNDLDHARVEVNGVDASDTNRAVGTRVMDSGEVHFRTNPRFETDGEDTPSGAVISSNLRVDSSATSVGLNNVGQPFTSIYTYSGSGKFYGFDLRFDDENVLVELQVDSNVIFEIDCDLLFDMSDSKRSQLNSFIFDRARASITFNPLNPIKYTSSVSIAAKANNGSHFRDLLGYIVTLTKES